MGVGDLINWINSVDFGIERFIIIVSIMVVTVVFAKIVSYLLKKSFTRSSKVLKVDPTHYSFLRHTATAIIYILGLVAIIYVIPALRSLSVTLLAGAGVIAVVLGFASQHAFSNIISGIFIVIFKPFRVGDRISVSQTTFGIVEDITLRHTVIRDFENKRIIIPNTSISDATIENSNIEDDKMCRWITFGISYDSDVDKAKKIMKDLAENHPLCIDNRSSDEKKNKDPIVWVRVVDFGDSSVNLRAYVWTKNPPDAWTIKCDLNESIKKEFDKNGIEIPFPYRTIVMKK